MPVRTDRGAPQGPGAGARTGTPGWHVEKRRGMAHEGAEEEPPPCLWGPFHSREEVRPAFAQVPASSHHCTCGYNGLHKDPGGV